MKICYACGTNKTHLDNGYYRWYQNKPFKQFLCNNCNRSIIRKEHDRPTRAKQSKKYMIKHFKELQVKKHNYYNKNKERILRKQKELRKPNRSIRFGNISLTLSFRTIRTGICSICGEKREKTDMHHWVYVRILPWYGREEVCVPCHNSMKVVGN